MPSLKQCTLFFSLFYMSACATHTTVIYDYQNDSRVDDAYIKRGVDFTKYKSIQIRTISVWYPNGVLHPDEDVSAANLIRAQDLFRQTMIDELGINYNVVDEPADNALWLHVEFVDLRSLQPDDPIPTEFQRMKFPTQAGHITLVAELRDSVSEEVLARLADLGSRSKGGQGIVDWNAIESDFRYWAQLLREWMDEVHGQT